MSCKLTHSHLCKCWLSLVLTRGPATSCETWHSYSNTRSCLKNWLFLKCGTLPTWHVDQSTYTMWTYFHFSLGHPMWTNVAIHITSIKLWHLPTTHGFIDVTQRSADVTLLSPRLWINGIDLPLGFLCHILSLDIALINLLWWWLRFIHLSRSMVENKSCPILFLYIDLWFGSPHHAKSMAMILKGRNKVLSLYKNMWGPCYGSKTNI